VDAIVVHKQFALPCHVCWVWESKTRVRNVTENGVFVLFSTVSG
jgi:hypothetical protein